MLFVKALKENVYRASDCAPLAAAVLYVAARVKDFPRLLHEMEEASSVPIRLINRWQRDVCESFKISLPPFRHFTLIPRIAQKLRMTSAQIEQCRQTCLNIEQTNLLESFAPQAVSAAAILLTCSVSESFCQRQRRLDAKAIAAVSYSNSKTVQNAFSIISPYADQLSTHLKARSNGVGSGVAASASASASANNGALASSIESLAIRNQAGDHNSGIDESSRTISSSSSSNGLLSGIGSSGHSGGDGRDFNLRPRSSSLCSNASTISATARAKKNKVEDDTL